MKIRFRCKLFGHDFRRTDIEDGRRYTYPYDYCRHCGLSKTDIFGAR